MFTAFDLEGEKYNSLTVLKRFGSKHGKALWICVCDCGNFVSVKSTILLRGLRKSCGCHRRTGFICNCKVCDKEFYIKLSHYEREGTYCSRKCMAIDYKNRLMNENNPNYRHGLAWTSEYLSPYRQQRRVDLANASGSYTVYDILEKLQRYWNTCYWCFEYLICYEIDHVIPLSRGGSNDKNNIEISCRACNRQKHNKFVGEWLLTPNCRMKRNEYNTGTFS